MGVWTPGPGPTSGEDTFVGDGSDEAVRGEEGNDTLSGNGGNDRLFGDGGNDILSGGEGDDELLDDSGDNTLDGGDGVDLLRPLYLGGVGDSTLLGGDGNDFIAIASNGTGIFTIDGGAGEDTLHVTYGQILAGSTMVGVETFILTQSGVVLEASFLSGIQNFWSAGIANLNLSAPGIIDLSDVNVPSSFTIVRPESPNQTFNSAAIYFNGTDGNDGFILPEDAGAALTAHAGDGDDILMGGAQNDRLSGGEGSNQLDGRGGDDTLVLFGGTDVADGGAGNDTFEVRGYSSATMDGGDGVDVLYIVPAVSFGEVSGLAAGSSTTGVERTIIYGGGGFVTIAPGSLPTTGELWIHGFTLVHATGGVTDLTQMTLPSSFTFNDQLRTGIMNFEGSAGDDQLLFPLLAGATLAFAYAGDGADVLQAGGGSDSLHGEDGNDTLIGAGGDDYLGGGEGDDALDGGAGVDTLYGEAGVDDLDAGDGDDLLVGGQGADALDGGDGIDTASYVSAEAGVSADLTGLTANTGDALGDRFTAIENLVGSNYADTLIGDGANNRLEGSGGSDTLDGGAGVDTMIGGSGNDTFVVDNTGDVTTELLGGGIDLVLSSVTRTLSANIENLTLTGGDAIIGYGNALNNIITGNAAGNSLYGFDGADVLDGGAGVDAMFGGNGDDTYYVDDAADTTTEVSALGGIDTVRSSVARNLTANLENLVLIGGAAISGAGNALDNAITGNSAANTLYGFDGNDRLDGGADADTLFGANGNDVYVVDDANDITVEGSALGGTDTVESSVDRNLNANFENLVLTGAAVNGYGNVLNNTLVGNGSANALYGFDGNDTINGGAGADYMFGGNGDDTYFVDNAGDVTSEVSPSGGIDTVQSTVSRNLTANLENLVLTGSTGITGAGNALNNIITGNSGANTLYGLDGDDTLNGGLGADTLQGGAGADTYVFSTALSAGNVDAIVGYSVADDTILLSNAVFTGLSAGALAAGAFHIGAAAGDGDDRIIYNSTTGQLYFDADGNGAGAAILFATLSSGLALTSADFIVGGP